MTTPVSSEFGSLLIKKGQVSFPENPFPTFSFNSRWNISSPVNFETVHVCLGRERKVFPNVHTTEITSDSDSPNTQNMFSFEETKKEARTSDDCYRMPVYICYSSC